MNLFSSEMFVKLTKLRPIMQTNIRMLEQYAQYVFSHKKTDCEIMFHDSIYFLAIVCSYQ